jgi:hypothetical protein
VTPLARPLDRLLARPVVRPLDRLLVTPRPRPDHPLRKVSNIDPPSPPLFTLGVCSVLMMLMTNLTENNALIYLPPATLM